MIVKTYPLKKTIKLKEISQLINFPLCLFFQLNNLSNYELENLKNELARNSIILKSAKTSFLNIVMREHPHLFNTVDPFKGSIFIGVTNSEPYSIKRSLDMISVSSQILLIGGIYEKKLFSDIGIRKLSAQSRVSCIKDIIMTTNLIPSLIIESLNFQPNLLFKLIKASESRDTLNKLD